MDVVRTWVRNKTTLEMSFDGFEDFILSKDSLALFEELYTRHVEHDIDRLNFAMEKVQAYVQEHKTFGQAKELLDLLVSKAATIHGDTILCKDNYAFVWSYVVSTLHDKGASLGLQAVKTYMQETVELGNVPVSYLVALGQDSAKSIQRQLDEAEQKANAEKAEREYRRTHPTDPDERRKLFASRFK